MVCIIDKKYKLAFETLVGSFASGRYMYGYIKKNIIILQGILLSDIDQFKESSLEEKNTIL